MTDKQYIKFKDASNLSADEKTRNRRCEKILQALLFFIPNSNPQSGKLMNEVLEWWLEIDSTDKIPIREIGIGKEGKTLLFNPWKNDLGLWTDEDITLDYFLNHFKAVNIEKKDFEDRWTEFTKDYS